MRLRNPWWPALLLAACLARLWLMPLFSSFWADEMATVFVVRHGASHPSLAVAPQLAASVYYLLPRAAVAILGSSEWAWRLPSMLALAVALWLVARIAARLLHAEAAWFAVFCCLGFAAFDDQAADARPYALGTCVVCAAVWFLILWLDRGRWRHAALFAAAAALLCRVHLAFWPIYAVLVLLAAFRLIRGESQASTAQILAVCAAVSAGIATVVSPALDLMRHAGAHVVAAPPSPGDLAGVLRLAPIAVVCATGALFARMRGWKIAWPAPAALFVIVAWWLVDPVSLFAFSRATGHSVFLPRYMDVALPGMALAVTGAIAVFLPADRWRVLSLALGAAVLIVLGNWSRAWPSHQDSDWRAAAAAFREQALPAGVPVLCMSPFVEARPPEWRPDYPIESFLYAHLLVYPLPGTLHPFPYELSPEAQAAARALWSDTLSGARAFVLLGLDNQAMPWREWLRANLPLAGWRDRKLGGFGNVTVVVFEAPPSPRAGSRQ